MTRHVDQWVEQRVREIEQAHEQEYANLEEECILRFGIEPSEAERLVERAQKTYQ